MRSLSPSISQTWTFTVSPGEKSGIWVFISAASTRFKRFIEDSYVQGSINCRSDSCPKDAPRGIAATIAVNLFFERVFVPVVFLHATSQSPRDCQKEEL